MESHMRLLSESTVCEFSHSALAVVGAGPRGTGLVERIAANAAAMPGDRQVTLHVVDPYPPGGGHIWRQDQSPLLWMNSTAAHVTMFTDDTVTLDGPARPGPSLYQWARGVSDGRFTLSTETRRAESAGEVNGLRTEIARLRQHTFASRRLLGAYLGWVFEQAAATLPPWMTLHVHRASAYRIDGPRDGRQRLWLTGSDEPLSVDAVILALGHFDAEPDAEQPELDDFAKRHALVHLPPGLTCEADLSLLRPGEDVLVRGLGLAFIDLMALVTEGRGGHWSGDLQDPDAELVYHPCGREPVLHVGSRRGVPYHPRRDSGYPGPWPQLPRFFGPTQVKELLTRPVRPDHQSDVLPLIGKELGFVHYHHLFATRPERTRAPWTVFESAYAAALPDSPQMDTLIHASVPDPADRFDLETLGRPLHGVHLPGRESVQEVVRACVRHDLQRHRNDTTHPELAVQPGLFSVLMQMPDLGDLHDTSGRWPGLVSSLVCGPPELRLRQLLALSEAGIVQFIGPDTVVTPDEQHGIFRARSTAVPDQVVEARALVDARLPRTGPERIRSPLVRTLYADGSTVGAVGALIRVDAQNTRLLDRDDRPHPRRFALGPNTTAPTQAFTPPGAGGHGFRQNDITARAAIALILNTDHRTGLHIRVDLGSDGDWNENSSSS